MQILALGRSIDRCNRSSNQGSIPIADTWPEPLGARCLRSRGFTLIELMVVLLIASVMFGLAVLSLKTLDRGLQIEAQRLSQLLSFARDYAQMRGRAVRFEADPTGYRFISREQGEWALILDEPVLRERAWDKPTQVRLERITPASASPTTSGETVVAAARPDQLQAGSIIEFGRDYVDNPFVLWLSQETQKVAVASNGLGRFEVQAEATQ